MKTAFQAVLKKYQPAYMEQLKAFELPVEQAQFTAFPIDLLQTIEDEQHPVVVILADQEPVGFFMLHTSARVAEYTDNPHAMLLTALSITYAQQGKGYAKQGMNQLASFAAKEYPAVNEIVLAVNKRNISAQKLYQAVGFQDSGRRKMGRKGEQLVFSLPL
ncbi:GNAT family N-acetyltransferase [Sediminibacillus albus]|uniref:Acetyltransferase (GNAT) family protein n=1 Tax=Sediminibacillus albus TaxID=407036 RepID=A0A1G8WKB7_9BACI|nr:GNAT family N-acetyltransferase [Sediminibacillus albus]SDJ78105.1 Acetyltransferase (GNAT) family protein [Sediminibacillus albus]